MASSRRHVMAKTSRQQPQRHEWSISYDQQSSGSKRDKFRRSGKTRDVPTYDPIVAGCRDGSGSFVHDRALFRACEAKFTPPSLATDPRKTVFIGRLPLLASEDDLRQAFSECGTIRFLCLVRDLVSGASRGYAFITFKHSSSVREALRKHNTVLKGQPIIVEMEVGRTLPGWKPRRLGGGFGGFKESGQMRFGGRACPHRTPAVPRSHSRVSFYDDSTAHQTQRKKVEKRDRVGTQQSRRDSTTRSSSRYQKRTELARSNERHNLAE